MKRFYKEVRAAPDFSIELDDRPIKTPAKATLVAPTRALAEAIAEEWREQGEIIRPSDMIVTRLANTAIDRVQTLPEDFVGELLTFGKCDLLCYRAPEPDELLLRQEVDWNPLLEWARLTLGADLKTTKGIDHIEQDEGAIAALENVLRLQNSWSLAGLQTATTITGSLILALALVQGRLDAAETFALSHLDDAFQTENWGRDQEAEKRTQRHAVELEVAARFMALARA